MKRLILLLSILTVVFVGCESSDKETAEQVRVTDIRVEPSKLTLDTGESYVLNVTVLPENADNKSVRWTSNDDNVVTVDPATGEVTAVAEGNAMVLAVAEDGNMSASCMIAVEAADPDYEFVRSGDEPGDERDAVISWGITADGILFISGNGGMRIYNSESVSGVIHTDAPWYEFNAEIKSIAIGKGITSIGKFAFAGLSCAERADTGRNVVHIGAGAFYDCLGLKHVDIHDNVSVIDNYAFYRCGALESVIIAGGSRLEAVGGFAFYKCAELKSIALPDGVTIIGDSAFEGCEKLETARIGCGIESIGFAAFKECRLLQDIVIPEGVISIKGQTFSNCRSMTEIVIPDSVQYIDNSAFYRCVGLTKVTIGSGILGIGAYAFNLCNNLADVVIMASQPPKLTQMTQAGTGSSSYYNFNYADDTLYVPAGCIEAYENDETWSAAFARIVEQ